MPSPHDPQTAEARWRSLVEQIPAITYIADFDERATLTWVSPQIEGLDRSFLRDVPARPEATAVVTAILELAGALGMETVAEGVETPAQREFLIERGCTFAQGFLLGRPAPARDLEPLLRRAASHVQS